MNYLEGELIKVRAEITKLESGECCDSCRTGYTIDCDGDFSVEKLSELKKIEAFYSATLAGRTING